MKRLVILMGVALAAFGCGRDPEPQPTPEPLAMHPVFHTTVSGESANRPAVQVDVLNPKRGWFSTAKLYLAVQSSRFPESTWVILPINVGDFGGCRVRFVQLPFEVETGDTVVFNLLDDIRLTPQEEERIITGCQLAGYCIVCAGSVYAPNVGPLLAPVVDDVATLLGEAIIDDMNMQKFQNFGTAEFIVPVQLPERAHEANRLTLLDDSNYARVQLRIYGPHTPLSLHVAEGLAAERLY